MNLPIFRKASHPIARQTLVFFLLTLTLNANSQTPTQVVITTQPASGPGHGTLMSVQPVVEIRDASNQRVTTSTAQVEIEIASGNGGTLGGTTRINAVNGIATFTDLTFSGVAGEPYVFRFKSEPVIAYDPFAYSSGSLTGQNGGSGWSGAWYGPSITFTDLSVNTTGFIYSNFTTSGGRSTYTSGTGGDAERLLAAQSDAKYPVIWLAFMGNYTAQGGGFSNVRLYLPGAVITGGVGGNGGISNWSILDNTLNAGGSTSFPLDGTTHLALLKIDYTAGTSALWIDPAITSFDGTQVPSATASVAPVFDRISLYNRTTGVGTDELTLTSTYKAALHLEQNLTAALSNAILPVQWKYFTASCEGDHTLLKWGTTDEQDNSHFIVERSSDVSSWSMIGTVQGRGNAGADQRYAFTDSAFSAKTYYRLRQIDFNGNEHVSKVVATSCMSAVDRLLQVFPNPAEDFLQVSGARPGSRYALMDARGHAVKTGTLSGGTNTFSLSGLPAGNYFLRVPGYPTRPVQVIKRGG